RRLRSGTRTNAPRRSLSSGHHECGRHGSPDAAATESAVDERVRLEVTSTRVPTFGARVAGVTYEERQAAYAVIRNSAGAVAAVCGPAGCWLPGGGALPGETPEETVVREVQEELGCALRVVDKIGEAVQYFFAAADDRHYAMRAVFFRAELG